MEMKSPLSAALIIWYNENRRELPWRETTDPYLIWISEIILQQTRVVQGLSYFNRFVTRFPDVKTLAQAQEDEVLKYWQGLGYYSRARNLHVAAQDIMSRFGGVFPQNHQDILSLRGIGDYTAAAICSFAWRMPYAVVDGNVYRVLSRFFGIDTPIDSGKGKKLFAELAQELLDEERPDLYNQAIMDFGALQCLPKSCDCTACPLVGRCVAHANRMVNKLPVKSGKTAVKSRYFNYLHIHSKGLTLLTQRVEKDIWQNLYELLLIETREPIDFTQLQQQDRYRKLFNGISTVEVCRMVEMPPHVLSHQVIHARFYEIEVSSFSPEMEKYLSLSAEEMNKYAISRLTELYLERL